MKLPGVIFLAFSLALNAQSDKPDTLLMPSPPHPSDSIKIFTYAQAMPKYTEGADSLNKYIKSNIRYKHLKLPKGFKGLLLVRFVVTADGNVTQPEVHRGLLMMNEANRRYELTPPDETISTACENEALRIVSTLHFIPGSQNGKKVYVYYNQPVFFIEP